MLIEEFAEDFEKHRREYSAFNAATAAAQSYDSFSFCVYPVTVALFWSNVNSSQMLWFKVNIKVSFAAKRPRFVIKMNCLAKVSCQVYEWKPYLYGQVKRKEPFLYPRLLTYVCHQLKSWNNPPFILRNSIILSFCFKLMSRMQWDIIWVTHSATRVGQKSIVNFYYGFGQSHWPEWNHLETLHKSYVSLSNHTLGQVRMMAPIDLVMAIKS